MSQNYKAGLEKWIEQEKAAAKLLTLLTNLKYDQSVELVFFRRPILNTSISEIIYAHSHADNSSGRHFSVFDSLELVEALSKLDLAPSRIDLGKLLFNYCQNKIKFGNANSFLLAEIPDHIGKDKLQLLPKDVVLYGFGRIGRIAARILVQTNGNGDQLRLKAIVIRGNSNDELQKRADLLRCDSVHGKFKGTVDVNQELNQLIINGQIVQIIYANKPEEIDYTIYGIDNALLIDNTGVKRDRDGLSKHLQARGISKVLLTAPGKGDIPNIVFGVNNKDFVAQQNTECIWSAASCTTNAICPVLDVIEQCFGIEGGHIETVHAYTNDQNLLDNYHSKYRRGRSAALNMVITETGADKAVAKVIPALAGKFSGNAVRVPTPDVSLAILNLRLKISISKESINDTLKAASLSGKLVEQIEFSSNNELVSTDVVGNPHASVIDGPATIVAKDNKGVILYVWYDNEYGYTCQVIRLAKELAGVLRLTYY